MAAAVATAAMAQGIFRLKADATELGEEVEASGAESAGAEDPETDDEDAPDSVSSANARSVADWKRSSGAFSTQRRTMRSSPGPILSRAVSRSGGSLVRTAVIVSAAVSALKARCPL